MWMNYGWKFPKPKEGHRYSDTGSTRCLKHDEPKQTYTKRCGNKKGKEPTCKAEDARGADSIHGWGRYPGAGNGNPLQYYCLENPMDRGAGGPQSTGSLRVEHDWVANTCTFIFGLLQFVQRWYSVLRYGDLFIKYACIHFIFNLMIPLSWSWQPDSAVCGFCQGSFLFTFSLLYLLKVDCDHDCRLSSVLNDSLRDFLYKGLHLLLSSSDERYTTFRSFLGLAALVLQINDT